MRIYRLNQDTVIRAEAAGALIFNRAEAKTAYIDRDALLLIYELISGLMKRGKIPLSTIVLLLKAGMIEPAGSPCERSLEMLEQCIRARSPLIPNSLSAPETLHIALTNVCDQACAGCFHSRTAPEGEKFLPIDLFNKVLHTCREVKVLQFAFGGGEPLLHPNLLDFVEMSSQGGVVPNITTNGNLLSARLASELRSAGLGQIQISLDGPTSAINSRTRANYEEARSAIRACREAGLRFGINTLLTRRNFRALPALFHFAKKNGAWSVNLLRPKPPVTSSDWLEKNSLTPSENLVLHGLLRSESRNGLPITVDQSMSFLARHRNSKELFYSGVWGCGAGRRFLTIDPEGTVYPCSHYREAVGSEGEFMRSWRESRLLIRFRQLELTLSGICASCEHRFVCRGCRAVVRELGGDFHFHDPHCPVHHGGFQNTEIA